MEHGQHGRYRIAARSSVIPVDNTVYDIAPPWWDEHSYLHFLYAAVNTARFAYFQSFLAQQKPQNRTYRDILDVGCGGGFLTEAFARAGGFRVTGIDPSGPSLSEARHHAQQMGLEITYVAGKGEDLPFPDAHFDVVSCCDVLEHVTDRSAVLAEVRRVLRPGGVFLYDTINRTWFSRIAFIEVAQRWPLTRFVPENFHDARFFVSPATLQGEMERQGLRHQCRTGLGPNGSPLALLRLLYGFRQVRRGRMTPGALGRRFPFAARPSTLLSYMGCALRLEK